MAFHKVNRQGVYERRWFTGLVCVEIISAGEVSSMSHCLSVFAAAAGPLITDDAHLDELNLILTMKTKCKHNAQMLHLWITNTIQFLCIRVFLW